MNLRSNWLGVSKLDHSQVLNEFQLKWVGSISILVYH